MTNLRFIKNKMFVYIVSVSSIFVILIALSIIVFISYKGAPVVFSNGLKFFTQTPAGVMSSDPGGIAPALIGTMYLLVSSTIIAVPISLSAAVFVTEFPNSIISKLAKIVVRTFLEISSITIGMLVFFLVVLPMGRFSAIAGTIALTIVMIPYVYTYIETSLSNVPKKYIEAAYSIGLNRFQVLFKVTLRLASKGIIRGIIVGMMKVTGETAPLVFTIFGARNLIFRGIDEPIDALPLMIFQFIQTGFENWKQLAWGASFVLLMTYFIMYMVYVALVRDKR